MQKFKKILSSFLASLLIISVCPLGLFNLTASAAASGTTGDCNWSLNGTVLTISGSGKMGDYSQNSLAPWGKKITQVIIKDGVTGIGKFAFYWSPYLTDVTIADSVMSIGNNAFYRCSALTSIPIPDGVTSIAYAAFQECKSLTSIKIPDGVTSINGHAFYGCTGLKELKIPNGVTSIGQYAFYGCTGLTGLTIPNGVTSLESYTFGRCTGLKSISIPNSVTRLRNNVFDGCTGLTSITMPDSISLVGKDVFSDCKIKNLIISGGSKKITSTMVMCKDTLESITVPDSVTSVDSGAFADCKIRKLIIAKGSKRITGTMAVCKDTVESVTVPDSITSIENDAFSGFTALNRVDITNIEKWCGIDFGSHESNPLSYAHNLYLNGTLLSELDLPYGITEIGKFVFSGCRSLTSVILHNSVTGIGEKAFADCGGLVNITIADDVTGISSNAFENTGYYNNENNWTDGVLYIGNHLIKAKSDISGEYYVKSEARTIADRAFSGCTKLTGINIPQHGNEDAIEPDDLYDTVAAPTPNFYTIIGREAFVGCTALKWVSLCESVIGDYAFNGCNDLTNITLLNGVTVGKHAFDNTGYYNDDNNWSDGVLYINSHLITAKSDISGDYTVKLGTKKIADGAFEGCTALTSVTIPADVDGIGDEVFNGCDAVTIKCRKDSAAQTYAENNGIPYELIKDTVAAPSAPTLDSKTYDTVILTEVAGYEYKIDDGEWQSGNVFAGLKPNSTHNLYQRIAETDDAYASEPSEALTVTTPRKRYDLNDDGNVNILDLITLKKFFANPMDNKIPTEQLDISGDGTVNSYDLVELKKILMFQ